MSINQYDVPALTPEDQAIHANLKKKVNNVLSYLNPRQERVIRMRFGINLATDYTLAEVGKVFGVNPERVRQIEARALRTLKHPSHSRKLRTFLNY
jgi:RNA polymerase primary sigma factor|tara:strand:+ start:395 stop:682 length:288 start_codon:yes stop_codon:yes gene_type:complete